MKTLIWIFLGMLGLLLWSPGRAQAETGFFLSAEVSGNFLGNNSNRGNIRGMDLDPGPGANVRLGYQGKWLGIRGTFFTFSMDHKPGRQMVVSTFFNVFQPPTTGQETAQAYGGFIDLLVRPFGAMDWIIQPYVAGGIGGSYLVSGLSGLSNISAAVPHLAIGTDIQIIDHLAIVIEGDWKPHFYKQDVGGFIDEDLRDDVLHFFGVSGGLKVIF